MDKERRYHLYGIFEDQAYHQEEHEELGTINEAGSSQGGPENATGTDEGTAGSASGSKGGAESSAGRKKSYQKQSSKQSIGSQDPPDSEN